MKIMLTYCLVVLLLLFFGCSGGGATSSSITLSADNTHAIADGTDTVILTATVRDGNGTPIEGQMIEFDGLQGAYPELPPGRTNADGTLVMRLSYPPVGPDRVIILTVTAASGGVISNKLVIMFSNPPKNAASVTLEADKTVVVVDGSDKVHFTVTVKDENGLPIAGQAVVFNAPPGPYLTGLIAVPYTNVAGQTVTTLQTATHSLISSGFTGSQTITFTASCGEVISSATTITFIQPPANAASITLAADKAQAVADSSDAVTLVATVRDSTGSPSPGQAVVFNVPHGVSPYLAPATTDTNGSTLIRLKRPPVGPATSAVLVVTATSGGVTSNEVAITFSNPPQNAGSVTLEADKTMVLADGTDQVRLTATVKDESGAPIAGQAVVFNIPFLPYLMNYLRLENYTNAAGQLVQILSQQPNDLVGSQSIAISATSGGVTSTAATIMFTHPQNLK